MHLKRTRTLEVRNNRFDILNWNFDSATIETLRRLRLNVGSLVLLKGLSVVYIAKLVINLCGDNVLRHVTRPIIM